MENKTNKNVNECNMTENLKKYLLWCKDNPEIVGIGSCNDCQHFVDPEKYGECSGPPVNRDELCYPGYSQYVNNELILVKNNNLYFHQAFDEFVGSINYRYNGKNYISVIKCDGYIDMGEYHITKLKICSACEATIPVSQMDEKSFENLSSKEKARIDFCIRSEIFNVFRTKNYVEVKI